MTNGTPVSRVWVVGLALALLTFWLYLPVAENAFVTYDDGPYVTENPNVSAGLTAEGVRWAFTSSHSANWHPLTWMAHMLDCELFGLDPAAHHLMGAGLHALNAALCLVAVFLLTRRLGPSLVVAALFAVHPQRVESVAWIAERKDVLSGTFFFLTLIAWERYARAPSKSRYVVVALSLALGLMAKQMLVTLPALLVLLDLWPLDRWKREGAKRVLVEKLPLFALCVAAAVATVVAQEAGAAIRSVDALPIGARVANAFVAYIAYALRMVWPFDLAVFYPHPALVAADTYSPVSARVLAAAAAFVAVTLLAFRARAAKPWLFVGWAWYVGMLVPVIGIVQVGAQWMADRYAYLPVIGLYVAAVFGAAHALTSVRARRIAFGVAAALVLACVPLTRAQIGTWRDTQTLFEHALDVTENNYVAHSNLGFLYHKQGDLRSAEREYLAALEIAPRMADQHSNLGAIYLARGDFPEARSRFDLALAINPRFTQARLFLGLLHEQRGDDEAALAAYADAVERDPESPEARVALGGKLLQLDRADEALAHCRRAVALAPSDPAARVALGRALAATGRPREGVLELQRAVAHPSRPPEAVEALVWLHATSSDRSVRDCARALQYTGALDMKRWQASLSLAAAAACAEQWELASENLRMAIAVAPKAERARVMELHRRVQAKEAMFE